MSQKKIQAIRGMNDILPEASSRWQYVEGMLQTIVQSYGYQEVRFPIVEMTDLFKRSVGEVTDIVEKEMYTFLDRNGDSLTLRPEGTAGCVRCGIEHGLFYNQQQKLWYSGPFFRHERPQKGRYRQFHQFGCESMGFAGPDIDAEMILMMSRMWKALGLTDHIRLEINSLGSPAARSAYRDALVAYFNGYLEVLDEDSLRRLETNPLRILDSKNPLMCEVIAGAPTLLDYLDGESKAHFDTICSVLDEAGLSYTVNPRLVRGLDYYTGTVFEWVTDALGAQGTVCAGGRYDGLVAQIGGHETPAIGFALGIERLIGLLETLDLLPDLDARVDVYFVLVGEKAQVQGLLLAEKLRNELPALTLMTHCGGGSFKSQFKRADKSGARVALVLGEDELAKEEVAVKFLREDRPQETVAIRDLVGFLKTVK